MTKSVRLRALTRAERRVLQAKVRDRRLTVRLHRRYRLIAEVARGRSFAEVADRVGCNVTMVYEWVHRFNASGFTTFEQPPNPTGRLPIITGPQIRELIDNCLIESHRAGAPLLGVDGAQAGPVLSAAGAAPADHRRMGPPPAAARRATSPAHSDLEDVA
jgi:Homeodomain-like domain